MYDNINQQRNLIKRTFGHLGVPNSKRHHTGNLFFSFLDKENILISGLHFSTMYWADHHGKDVIMRARMDGSEPEVLVDTLKNPATGLSLDAPNKRLYFVDGTIKIIKVDTKQIYVSIILHCPD